LGCTDWRHLDIARKERSDEKVGNFEKKHDLPPGTIRNPDGRDTRSDKKTGTIRRENEKQDKKK
jgi:hypothetical protein